LSTRASVVMASSTTM